MTHSFYRNGEILGDAITLPEGIQNETLFPTVGELKYW